MTFCTTCSPIRRPMAVPTTVLAAVVVVVVSVAVMRVMHIVTVVVGFA